MYYIYLFNKQLDITNYIYFSNNVIINDDSNALIDIYTS